MAYQSLLIDTTFNDLVLDANGNIAVCDEPYRLAQDAACAIRLFHGEIYYATDQGIPYWDQVLGHWPPLSLVKAYLQRAALTVPGVVSATVYITGFVNRKLSGQVQVVDSSGTISAARF
jgi:hypothetical protein